MVGNAANNDSEAVDGLREPSLWFRNTASRQNASPFTTVVSVATPKQFMRRTTIAESGVSTPASCIALSTAGTVTKSSNDGVRNMTPNNSASAPRACVTQPVLNHLPAADTHFTSNFLQHSANAPDHDVADHTGSSSDRSFCIFDQPWVTNANSTLGLRGRAMGDLKNPYSPRSSQSSINSYA